MSDPPAVMITPSGPDLARGLDDAPELGPLLVLGQHVALFGGGEAALRAQAQLIERDVPGRLVDPPLERVLLLQRPALGRHEPEHDLLVALGQEAQRLEAARALGV